MSETPKAHLPDLATITQVYPDDKRLTVTVPHKAFGKVLAPGGEVELFERPDPIQRQRPHDESGRVRGRVKRLLVEVEIDLSTYEAPVPQGQESL